MGSLRSQLSCFEEKVDQKIHTVRRETKQEHTNKYPDRFSALHADNVKSFFLHFTELFASFVYPMHPENKARPQSYRSIPDT